MARISTYDKDLIVEGQDRWIGSKWNSASKETLNFSSDSVADYFNRTGKITTGAFAWTYKPYSSTEVQYDKTFELIGHTTDTVDVIGLAGTIRVSFLTLANTQPGGFIQDQWLNSTILLAKNGFPSIYGIYRCTNIVQDGFYYLIDLAFISGRSGTIQKDESCLFGVFSYGITEITATSPILATGTSIKNISVDPAYGIPTTIQLGHFDTAYNRSLVGVSVTGTTTKTLTLTEQSGATLTASWTDLGGVSSVFGRIGDVIAVSGDYNTSQVTESTNLYFTPSRARTSISLTTTGVSGAATYDSGTGILNIPNYQVGVSSFNTRTGAVTLLSTDVTGALGFTPYDASNPAGYITSAALSGYVPTSRTIATSGPLSGGGDLTANRTISISQSNSTTDGFLSSVDWGVFNAKQSALNGVGFVKISGTTISYDNSTYYLASNPAGYTSNLGTVTSVSMSMPSAFSVSGSPITTAGTLAVTAIGDTTQYIAGDGSLISFPIAGQAGTIVRQIRNTTGATLTKGTVVYISGASGNKPTVSKAIATSDITSAQTFGLCQTDIPNNSNGYVVSVGDLIGLDTSAFAEGAQLYLSSTTAGTYTTTKQYAPAHLVYIGVITRSHPTQGQIEVKIQNGYELDELHNVAAQTPSNNDGLFYESSTNLWKNKSIATVLGYTPEQPLSFTSPLVRTTNTVSIPAATSSVNGYLSSADWATFNAKQSAGNYITSLTGEATASGPGAAAVTLSTSAVTGKILTGLNLTPGGSISATDSILQAFGKVQNQISALVGGVIYKGVWNASTNTPTLTSGVGAQGNYYIVNVAGSTNLDGITDWKVGDWAIYNGTAWNKVDNTDAVSSVNGFTGAVSLTTANISEVTNLYYTDARARGAVSLTTTGSSGAATYNSSTGILNIPNYGSALSGYLPLTGGTLTGGLVINPANTAVVGLDVASNTFTLRTDTSQPFNRQLTTTLGSGTLVKMQAAGYGAVYVTDLGFYTSSSSAVNTTPNLYLTGGNNRVGINTTTPAYTLDVVGTAGVSGALTANSFVKIGGTSAQFLMADGSVTTSPSASGFVPYSGATTDVNLGNFDLNTAHVTVNGDGGGGVVNIFKNGSRTIAGNGYVSLFADNAAFGFLDWVSANTRAAQFSLSSITNNTTVTLTIPNASGTIALTSNLSSYVPYTGATTAVNIGTNLFTAGYAILNGSGTNQAGVLSLFKGTSRAVQGNGYLNLYGEDGKVGFVDWITGNVRTFEFSLASLSSGTTRVYTLPNATGTLALTSDLSTYVPYTGATGAVNLGAYDLTVNGIKVGRGAGSVSDNTVVGNIALNANTTGSSNTAIGYAASNANTTAGNNTSMGYFALATTTTGGNNTAIGSGALTANSTGTFNTGIGKDVLASNTTGQNNVAVGPQALYSNSTANNNTAFGYQALFYNTGANNTAIGKGAGINLTTGSNNTIIGGYFGDAGMASNVILSDGAGNIRFQWDGTNIKLNGNTVGSNAYTSTAYLPLSGGTLTGALNGTSAVFSSSVTATRLILSGGTSPTGLYFGHTDKVVLANYTVGGGIDFETNGGNITMQLSSGGLLSTTGGASFSGALSGTSATFVASGTYTNLLIGTTSTTGAILSDANRSNLVLGAGTSNKIVFNNASTTQNGYIYSDNAELSLGYPASGTFNVQKVGVGNVFTIASSGAATFSNFVRVEGQYLQVANASNPSVYINNTSVQWRAYLPTGNNFAISDAVRDVLTLGYNGSASYFNGCNVGIGTTAPGVKLSVFTSGQSFTSSTITYSAGSSQGFLLDNSAGTSQSGNAIWFANSGLYSAISSTRVDTGTWGTDLRFYTHPDAITNQYDVTERMRITSSGTMLVGTTSTTPVSSNISGISLGNAGQLQASTDGRAMLLNRFTDGTLAEFHRGGTSVGSISVTTVLTTYNTTSDYRLKEDLKPINGLEIVNKIKVYNYKWKSLNERMDGVLAHELQEVLPYAVQGVKDGEQMQSVDYSKIVPVLIQAIKDQQVQIEQLKNK